jgi:predicted ATPase/RsiW-degrading membrane proteinase PrsW (M82 family)
VAGERLILDPGFFATYAVIQAVALLAVVRLLDPFERPPAWLIFLLAAWGATGAALIALAGNSILRSVLSGDARDVFGDAVSAPLVEEVAKGLALVAVVLLTRRLPRGIGGWRLEGVTAGLVCGAAIGIGFSFTEDFFYFVNHASNEGVQAAAEIFIGRRDFFGPTALHHPLFTAAFGAGVGAAIWSRSWRGRMLWPLGGLAVAVLMHAINNGFIELLLVLRHGLPDAAAWVNGAPVSPEVDSTADSAEAMLIVLDYAYVALFAIAVVLWQRNERRGVAGALQQEVDQGLLSPADLDTVCGFGGRVETYSRLVLRGRWEEFGRLRAYHHEVGLLGMARWRAERDPQLAEAIPGQRRRVLAVQGVVKEPGRIRTPQLGIVGRDRELRDLERLLIDGDAREVTLSGPGGIGKTRVAIELASRLQRRFAHGAFFVDLATLHEPGEVVTSIASTLDLQIPAGTDAAEWLGRLLRDRELLLVLDNFEHVLEAVALVGSLLGAVPRLRVLVTSRVALGLPEETEYDLGPLPAGGEANGGVSPAASLFTDRARRAGVPAADLSDTKTVEEICLRLDGLPLAIELVAPRARTLPLSAIRGRMGSILDLATTEGLGIASRQRTLRGTVQWSEELLPERARETFRRLGLFPAGCRLSALEESWSGDGLLDDLQSLAESSLLVMATDPDEERRYRMLGTIREYALERGRPRSDELARYGAALIRELASSASWSTTVLLTLQIERPNLVGAIEELESTGAASDAVEVMTAIGPLWESGNITHARERIEGLLTAGALDQAVRARGQRLAGRLALLQGDYADAEHALWRASQEADADRSLRFACLLDLGWVQMFTGKLDRAKDRFEAAIAEAREALGAEEVGRATVDLGRALAELGDSQGGLRLARDGVGLLREAGDDRGAISARSTLARIQLINGNPDEARHEAAGALEDARELEDRLREAEALFPLATATYLLGDLSETAKLATERLTACGELGDTLGLAEVLDLCALLVNERRDQASAERLARAASDVRGAVGAEPWPWDREQLRMRLDGIPEARTADPSVRLEDALSLAGAALQRFARDSAGG